MKQETKQESETPYAALERLFHEPARLGILSLLSGAAEGATFTRLKDELQLTDGNLSRHVKALEDAGVVALDRRFAGVKPQTTISITESGREQFIAYLKALEDVLQRAARAVGAGEKSSGKGGAGFRLGVRGRVKAV